MFEGEDGGGFATCPQCGTEFKYRSNKTYCSTKCRVYGNRAIQNARSSPSKARHNAEFFDTARRMGETFYALPPQHRLGHMQELIREARDGNTQLRELLSNWKLRHPHPEHDSWMFPHGRRVYSTIAQEAQSYCLRFWGANVGDVVYDRVPEPPTGEVEKP